MNFLKLLLVSIILLSASCLSAQEEADLSKRSEIKVNGLYLILGAIELDYEYILNEESSVGVSATYIFEEFSDWKWGITPYYRLFFGKQAALGFFVEGNATLLGYEDYDYIYDQVTMTGMSIEENKITSGFGLAVGGKFKTSRDVVVEVYGGIGRVLGDGSYESYPRFGINIGKRF